MIAVLLVERNTKGAHLNQQVTSFCKLKTVCFANLPVDDLEMHSIPFPLLIWASISKFLPTEWGFLKKERAFKNAYDPTDEVGGKMKKCTPKERWKKRQLWPYQTMDS